MKFRNIVLTVVSYVFYGWANPLFVVLILVSTLSYYLYGLVLLSGLQDQLPDRIPILSKSEGRTIRQKTALVCSIVANLSLLGFFKYWNFGAETLRQLAEAAGWTLFEPGDVLHVVLPASLPYILAGMRVSLALALIVTVVAEMIAGSAGIGYHVMTMQYEIGRAHV